MKTNTMNKRDRKAQRKELVEARASEEAARKFWTEVAKGIEELDRQRAEEAGA